jgi:hypothetical protein
MAEIAWPDRIRCHDTDLLALRYANDGLFRWQERGGRPTCPFCGSVSPAWVFQRMAAVKPSPPPWAAARFCQHAGHVTAADFRACEDEQLAAWRAWEGIEVADQKYGWPHKLYLHLRGTSGISAIKFYCIHLRDLVQPAFTAVTAVLAAHTGIRFLQTPDGGLAYTVED